MSRALKIVLPDPAAGRLNELADSRGEPLATLAANILKERLLNADSSVGAPQPPTRASRPRPAAWLEPEHGIADWRAATWGAIVTLHHRYPQQLAAVQHGWWEHPAQRETLAALSAWREELDRHGQDPRDELLFHEQLTQYGNSLRSQARGVARAWQPDAPPDNWTN